MQRLVGAVHFAVGEAGAGGHALHLAGLNGRVVAHRILMGYLPVEHERHDFHLRVRVLRKAGIGGDVVIIKHAQRAEVHVLPVVVVGKGEQEVGAEPLRRRSVVAAGGGKVFEHDESREVSFSLP